MSSRRLDASSPRPGGLIGWVSAVSALGRRPGLVLGASVLVELLVGEVMDGSWGRRGGLGRHRRPGKAARGHKSPRGANGASPSLHPSPPPPAPPPHPPPPL